MVLQQGPLCIADTLEQEWLKIWLTNERPTPQMQFTKEQQKPPAPRKIRTSLLQFAQFVQGPNWSHGERSQRRGMAGLDIPWLTRPKKTNSRNIPQTHKALLELGASISRNEVKA